VCSTAQVHATVITRLGLASVPHDGDALVQHGVASVVTSASTRTWVLRYSSPLLAHVLDSQHHNDASHATLALAADVALPSGSLAAFIFCAEHASGLAPAPNDLTLVRAGQCAMGLVWRLQAASVLSAIRTATQRTACDVLDELTYQHAFAAAPTFTIRVLNSKLLTAVASSHGQQVRWACDVHAVRRRETRAVPTPLSRRALAAASTAALARRGNTDVASTFCVRVLFPSRPPDVTGRTAAARALLRALAAADERPMMAATGARSTDGARTDSTTTGDASSWGLALVHDASSCASALGMGEPIGIAAGLAAPLAADGRAIEACLARAAECSRRAELREVSAHTDSTHSTHSRQHARTADSTRARQTARSHAHTAAQTSPRKDAHITRNRRRMLMFTPAIAYAHGHVMCGRDIDIPHVHRLTMRTFARQEARLMDCAMRLSKWQRGGAEALAVGSLPARGGGTAQLVHRAIAAAADPSRYVQLAAAKTASAQRTGRYVHTADGGATFVPWVRAEHRAGSALLHQAPSTDALHVPPRQHTGELRRFRASSTLVCAAAPPSPPPPPPPPAPLEPPPPPPPTAGWSRPVELPRHGLGLPWEATCHAAATFHAVHPQGERDRPTSGRAAVKASPRRTTSSREGGLRASASRSSSARACTV
jgi:hypothetical protein